MSLLATYQNEVSELLRLCYPSVPVTTEWRAITNIRGVYSPRIDLAVGPFAAGLIHIDRYDEMFETSLPFITQLIEYDQLNVEQFSQYEPDLDYPRIPISIWTFRDFNRNSRCFLAIEIENQVSRKHLLGGAVNAAALGRIGIVIGWNQEKVRALIRLRDYWHFLGSVGKNTFSARNILILSPEQFTQAVRSYMEHTCNQ